MRTGQKIICGVEGGMHGRNHSCLQSNVEDEGGPNEACGLYLVNICSAFWLTVHLSVNNFNNPAATGCSDVIPGKIK